MIDISEKKPMLRIATAEGTIFLKSKSIDAIQHNTNPKGDVLENAKLAAIQSVKLTPQYIFMAHPININAVKVNFEISSNTIVCQVTVTAIERTGVELEAMSGVMGALMAIFDLSKRYEKNEEGQYPVSKIENVHVVNKIKREVEP
jgi:cyclic pyranopterin phosphate synthase